MLALLKEKSQVGIASKPRKKYEALKPKLKVDPVGMDFAAQLKKLPKTDARGLPISSYGATPTNQINPSGNE